MDNKKQLKEVLRRLKVADQSMISAVDRLEGMGATTTAGTITASGILVETVIELVEKALAADAAEAR